MTTILIIQMLNPKIDPRTELFWSLGKDCCVPFLYNGFSMSIYKTSFPDLIMELQWYAVSLGALAALFILFYIQQLIVSGLRKYLFLYFLKHVYYPLIPRLMRGSCKTTWFELLLTLLFLIGNTLCLT